MWWELSAHANRMIKVTLNLTDVMKLRIQVVQAKPEWGKSHTRAIEYMMPPAAVRKTWFSLTIWELNEWVTDSSPRGCESDILASARTFRKACTVCGHKSKTEST